jgi:hypothetical protein
MPVAMPHGGTSAVLGLGVVVLSKAVAQVSFGGTTGGVQTSTFTMQFTFNDWHPTVFGLSGGEQGCCARCHCRCLPLFCDVVLRTVSIRLQWMVVNAECLWVMQQQLQCGGDKSSQRVS